MQILHVLLHMGTAGLNTFCNDSYKNILRRAFLKIILNSCFVHYFCLHSFWNFLLIIFYLFLFCILTSSHLANTLLFMTQNLRIFLFQFCYVFPFPSVLKVFIHTFPFTSQTFFFFLLYFFLLSYMLMVRLSLICLLPSSWGRKQGWSEGSMYVRRKGISHNSGNIRSFSCLAPLQDFFFPQWLLQSL